MGNAPATLVILTDQPHVIAGQTLSGTVYLDISAPTGIHASSLCLSFKGSEISTIAAYMARADTTFREEGRCNIISLTVPLLHAMEGTDRLEMGQYELPFTIRLPNWLPSTMICKGQEGSGCGIRYYLEAFALRGSKHKLNSPLMQKEILILGKSKGSTIPQSLPSPPIQIQRACAKDKDMTVCEEHYKLFSLFCYPRGKIRMQAKISPTTAQLGDTLTLTLDITNESQSNLDEIEIKLRECARWKVGTTSSMPRKEKMNRCVAENVITHRQLSNGRRASRPSGQVSPAAAFDGGGPRLPPDSSGDAIKGGEVTTKRHHIKINVAIPYDARCTYENGTLLSVNHVLAISLKLNGCSFLTSQPELHVPLKLQSPSAHDELVVQMNKKRPRMVRRSVYGHDLAEKLVGDNPLFDSVFLRRTYGQGEDEAWSHLAEAWCPVHVGRLVELDLPNSGKVGGEEDISLL